MENQPMGSTVPPVQPAGALPVQPVTPNIPTTPMTPAPSGTPSVPVAPQVEATGGVSATLTRKRTKLLVMLAIVVVLVLGGGMGLWYILTLGGDTQGIGMKDGAIMQMITAEMCRDTEVGTVVSLVDARDDNNYKVRKMPDGKCWMISNLAYAGGGKDTYGDVQTLVFADTTEFSQWTELSGAVSKFATTNNFTGSDEKDRDGNTIKITEGILGGTGGPQCASSKTGGWESMESECLSYLYNWCAAAGLDETTIPTCEEAHSSGSGEGYALTGVIGKSGGVGGESKGDDGSSICPSGWRLPVGQIGSNDDIDNAKNELAVLNGSMYKGEHTSTPDENGGSDWVKNWQPAGLFAGISSGYFMPGGFGLMDQSVGTFYWASSLTMPAHASLVNVNFESVIPGTGGINKHFGLAVRCVL